MVSLYDIFYIKQMKGLYGNGYCIDIVFFDVYYINLWSYGLVNMVKFLMN